MWTKLSHTIIKYRLLFTIIVGLVTVFMSYFAVQVEMSYNFVSAVPSSDPEMQNFVRFKEMFGEDGNIVALGIQDSSLYDLENFKKYDQLSLALSEVEYVTNVVSIPNTKRMVKDQEKVKFRVEKIFEEVPDDKTVLDSLLKLSLEQRFYSDRLVNRETGAVILLVSIDKKILSTPTRLEVTGNIMKAGENFSDDTGIEIRYAGLPFVRSVIMSRIANELRIFLLLSVLVTGLILLLFFRSWDAVVFPMMIIAVVVVWVVGCISLFGYKITLLSGLIPPLIVVIGIPNSVYLLNKYHQEFEKHGNKIKAISVVTRKIGMVTLITNFTTAIGFLVLISTDIVILRQFGIVAGINIMATFFVSIVLIPAVFSWLPPPTVKQLRHLKFKPLDLALTGMDTIVHRYRPYVYVITVICVGVSVVGMYKIESVSHIVDDIPKDSKILHDLEFFESNFGGIMPLEIIIDTDKKKGVTNLQNLRLIDEFEEFLGEQKDISQPISVVSFVKAARQAFYNNNPDRYDLPSNNRERAFLLRYLNGDSTQTFGSFVDSSMQIMRISTQVADIGSKKMEVLLKETVQPKIDSLFGDTDFKVTVTGTTPLFIKGNKFLIENLRFSLFLAFIIISITMGVLFANIRMILISLVPNIIPLIIIAGIMGYFGIPLKPSTALIFSIAFGISVDDSIHFLAKYRQELFANNFFVPIAVTKSLRETGSSMMYTSIILFAGFVIFSGSDFGGTIALGVLTSTTLLIAMLTNLIILPSLLLSFDDGKRKKGFHPLIEQYDTEAEFHNEQDDEEIDLGMLKVEKEAPEEETVTVENKKTAS